MMLTPSKEQDRLVWALKDALVQVEAETATIEDFRTCYPRDERGLFDRTRWSRLKAMDAYRGDLNAAEALHKMALPGLDFELMRFEDASYATILAGHPDFAIETYMGDNLARAWLVVILKALIAQLSRAATSSADSLETQAHPGGLAGGP